MKTTKTTNGPSPRGELTGQIAAFLRECGLDQVYGCVEGRDPKNRYRSVTFCRARTVDGEVRVYSPGFVQVKWQADGRRGDAVLHSKQDALDFLYFQFVARDGDAAQGVVDRSGLVEEVRKLGVLSRKKSKGRNK